MNSKGIYALLVFVIALLFIAFQNIDFLNKYSIVFNLFVLSIAAIITGIYAYVNVNTLKYKQKRDNKKDILYSLKNVYSPLEESVRDYLSNLSKYYFDLGVTGAKYSLETHMWKRHNARATFEDDFSRRRRNCFYVILDDNLFIKWWQGLEEEVDGDKHFSMKNKKVRRYRTSI